MYIFHTILQAFQSNMKTNSKTRLASNDIFYINTNRMEQKLFDNTIMIILFLTDEVSEYVGVIMLLSAWWRNITTHELNLVAVSLPRNECSAYFLAGMGLLSSNIRDLINRIKEIKLKFSLQSAKSKKSHLVAGWSTIGAPWTSCGYCNKCMARK